MSVHESDELEIPRYFLCPISLQIMKDPVTTPTGITYDRVSIEQWLFVRHRPTCPITNTPLPPDTDLTPNHTLRRLIQSWSSLHSDRIPTPRPPASLPTIQSLLHPLPSLPALTSLASESESNRLQIIRANAPRLILTLHPISYPSISLLLSLRLPPEHLKPLVSDNYFLIETLTDLISSPDLHPDAITFLKTTFDLINPKLIQRLKPEFFVAVVGIIKATISNNMTKTALQVLVRCCEWGTNRGKMVAAGVVEEIIEMEIREGGGKVDKRMTEMGLEVMEKMCKCAEGRAAVAGHAGGMAVVGERMIRVSAVADEKAVGIMMELSRCLEGKVVVREMAEVGMAAKLCLVMQGECLEGVKEKARFVLRLNARVWKQSYCVVDCYLDQCFLLH